MPFWCELSKTWTNALASLHTLPSLSHYVPSKLKKLTGTKGNCMKVREACFTGLRKCDICIGCENWNCFACDGYCAIIFIEQLFFWKLVMSNWKNYSIRRGSINFNICLSTVDQSIPWKKIVFLLWHIFKFGSKEH